MKWKQDLIRDIRSHTPDDDRDFISVPEMQYATHMRGEFTPDNRKFLTERFMEIKDRCRAILEIGVCRNSQQSSTYCFLNNKKDDTIYVGIDIDDKSFLNNVEKNIFTIQNSSWNLDFNRDVFNKLGINQFDFIFIDGWHSVNAVLTEWEYTDMLSDFGIVGFHDTAGHDGPYKFVRALNKDLWTVEENLCPDDYGIGFARKKLS